MTLTGGYINPSVIVEEIPSPVVATAGIAPTVIGIVGDSQRFRTYSEIVILTAEDPVVLSQWGIDISSVVVRDRFTGQVYAETADYVVVQEDGDDLLPDTADDFWTITRDDGGAIPSGGQVIVSYQFTDLTYYDARFFTNFETLKDFYGSPLTPQGTINSDVSLAAFLAFFNGAETIVVAPTLSAGATPTPEEFDTALNKLSSIPEVNVVVPVSGESSVHASVLSHVQNQSAQGNRRRGFVGLDGSTSPSSVVDIQSTAQGFNSSRMVLVAPDHGKYFSGLGTGVSLTLGGPYLAAASAGAFASRPSQIPMTHKSVLGFESVRQFTEVELLQLQQSGVFVLARRRTGGIICRHGLTTSMSSIYTRELSIVAPKDSLFLLLKETVEQQELVGSNITINTPDLVMAAVAGALEFAMALEMIFSYSDLQWRIPPASPTTIQIKFMYRPSLPLNNIVVQFAVDTATGSAEFSEEIINV